MPIRVSTTMVALGCIAFLAADIPHSREKDKQSLAKLQSFVGSWRGVGQVRRGSNQGAWSEKCAWAWKFDKSGASLTFTADKARFFQSGSVRAIADNEFALTAVTPDNDTLLYQGACVDSKLVLTCAQPVDGLPARMSLRQVADGDRMVVLYESLSVGGRYARMAEVGYTREGSSFGKGTAYVECIVTGGKGTIAVTHQGKTYYVCCSGCRDLFNEDPEAVIAAYEAERQEAAHQ